MSDRAELKKAISLIEKSERVFLALRESPTIDALAVAAIIAGRLQKRGKEIAVSALPAMQPKWEFLPLGALTSLPPLPRDVFITINTISSPIGELRYEKEEAALTVILSPKEKPIKTSDIKISQGAAKTDCIVTIGAEVLDQLGALFSRNPQLFFETPIINIDASPLNDHFGEANLVNPKVRAVSEIGWEFAKELLPSPLTSEEATLVLAGILTKTKNFLDGKVLPETLTLTAEAITAGGKRDLVLGATEEARPISLLQLWGRAAVRSRLDIARSLLISVITAEDFAKTKTAPEALGEIVRLFEAHFHLPSLLIVFFEHPKTKKVSAIFRSRDFNLLKEIQRVSFGEFERGMVFARAAYPSFREAENRTLQELAPLWASRKAE
ncbi:MAG: hypothetical protein HYT40_02210 [Candidatus Sungbacteria bacterium]|uniref:Phosphoesterase RecJ domain protein n=1 Tax=Candidatus Sungiibacteriota bacterium TaxID=2750080 RepID=A0A931SBN6_9BACT|nr:hypothetical protein [Candidatus Sungbacteria bacterium]